jgi:hypothetical protein
LSRASAGHAAMASRIMLAARVAFSSSESLGGFDQRVKVSSQSAPVFFAGNTIFPHPSLSYIFL